MDAFLGMVMAWPMDWAPRGWMLCDGSLLQVSQYMALYSLLGNKYGGDGVTTFALPDLRGRTMVGFGAGPGLTPRNIGDKDGAETVTLSVDSTPAHSHIATFTPGGSGGVKERNPAGELCTRDHLQRGRQLSCERIQPR
jgi:microcystin-dependent protein